MVYITSGILLIVCLATAIADKTITCPSCWHFSSDSGLLSPVLGLFENQACLAANPDLSDPDMDTTTCTATGTDVPKCIKYTGQISFGFLGNADTHMRSCLVEGSDPGNMCESISEGDNKNSEIAGLLTPVTSKLNFLGDETFAGTLCFSDDATSTATNLYITQIVFWVCLAFIVCFTPM